MTDQLGDGRPPGPPARTPIGANGRRIVRGYSMSWLRAFAAIIYTTDPHGWAVARLPQFVDKDGSQPFRDVSIPTLKMWCQEDGWVARRQEAFDRWRRDVEASIGSELSRARREEFLTLEAIWKEEVATFRASKPRSREGMLKALIALGERLDVLRRQIGMEIAPVDRQQQQAENNLTDDEADALLRRLKEIRDEKTQAKPPEET